MGRALSLARLLAGVCAALSLVSCGRPEGGARGGGGPAREPREVAMGKAELRPMERSVAATGTLLAWERSTLSAKVPGRIEKLEVDIGTRVRRGDVVARIEARDYELSLQRATAALAQARAALSLPPEGDDDRVEVDSISVVKQNAALLEEAEKNHERVRRLVEAGIAPQSELETAEANHTVARSRHEAAIEETRMKVANLAERRADHAIARKQLEDASLLAPFDGVIEERLAGLGQYVGAGTPVVTIVCIDPLRLRLDVPERAAARVRAGQAVRLRAEGMEIEHAGKIARLSPAIGERDRMLRVEADIANDGALRPGQFARGWIIVDEREEGVSVPASAVIAFAGIEKVVVAREGKALERTVMSGRRGDGWVEIVEGLEAGEEVALAPVGLRTGDPLTRAGEGKTPAGR